MAFTFYNETFTKLSTTLTAYVNDTASNVIGAISPVATTMLTIYVILWGWAMMRGMIQEPIMDAVQRMLRLVTVVAIAINLGHYNGFLSDWLWQSPDAMASFVGGGDGSGTATYLDNLMEKMYDFGDIYHQYATANAGKITGMPAMGPLITAYVIWAAGVAATGYAAFLMILAKMALAVLLGIGPIFVLMTMFEPTKKFFDAWLGQVLNFVFIVILTAAVINLIFAILEAYLGAASGNLGDLTFSRALPPIIFALIATLCLMQMSGVASALGGGVALGTMGAVSWAYNKASGAARAGKNLATGKTLSDMRAARRQRATNAKWAANNPGMTARAGKAVAGAPKAIYRKITGANKNTMSKN